jgi:hypothetical protein
MLNTSAPASPPGRFAFRCVPRKGTVEGMNNPNECLDDPDPLVQPMVLQLAMLAFPYVTLTGDELTALDAAVQTGADAPYDLARVLKGRAYWRTGRMLAPEACRVLQRLERRNGDAAPDQHQQPPRVADVVRTPLDSFEHRGQAFVRRRRPRGGSRDGWIDLPLPPEKRLIEL